MTTRSPGRRALTPRLPHAGEIRLGEKRKNSRGREYPARLDRFRLTGPEHSIRSVADVYGGDPRPWDDPDHPGAWEVHSGTDTLHVLIPVDTDDALDAGWYEMWAKGGRVRRCDGQTCTRYRVEGDGDQARVVTDEVPCMCDPDADPDTICKPTTRLRVILPLVEGLGTWRLSTGSVYAAAELAGSIAALRAGGATGLVPAYLRIAQREQKRHGLPTRRFPVPVIEPIVRPASLVAADTFRDQAWRDHAPQLTAPPPHVAALEAATADPAQDTIRSRWRELTATGLAMDRIVHALQQVGVTSSQALADDHVWQQAVDAVRRAAAHPHRDPDAADPDPGDEVIDGQEAMI